MHDYIVKNSGPQPAAYINQMPPAPQPIDPRMLAAAMQQMGAMQEAPMSANDGVNITISIEPNNEVYAENYVDPYLQQGEIYSQRGGGIPEREAVEIFEREKPIKDRASQIIAGRLGLGSCGDMGQYDIGSKRIYRR